MRILHMFNYQLNNIENELTKVKEQGFEAIQISPIQPNKFDEDNIPWWGFYQPISFNIGNQLGTKDDLIRVCKTANDIGIKIICDVVLNHTAGNNNGSIEPHEKVDYILRCNKHFWKDRKQITNWKDRYQVINYSLGCPGLRLDNYDLQDIIINFLNELIECGVRGFRIDAAKNISLPDEGGNHFWWRVFNSLNKHDELFNYAEIIFEDKSLLDRYANYINIVSSCQISDKSRLINYVENHDTYLEFKSSRIWDNEEILRRYENLCSDYESTLFFIRPLNPDYVISGLNDFDTTWMDKRVKYANIKK